ncbi:IS1106 transposase [Neisseria meningitidis]|nr:IS1106 transposase [Neisseria meningitidis]
MSTFFQQTAQAMIAKHIDRFPLLKLDQVIDWQPQLGGCSANGGFFAFIVDEQKPVRRCLALAQRERFSKVLKHQVNRFRTICTVCGFVALS